MMQDNPTVARLRARLDPQRPAIAMAAHNPLAAKLAALHSNATAEKSSGKRPYESEQSLLQSRLTADLGRRQ